MSFMLLGILNAQAAGGASPYWLSFTGNNTVNARSSAIDSSDNTFSFGDAESTGAGSGDSFYLVKQDPFGAVLWQRALGGASTEAGNTIDTDSSDNVYAAGWTQSSGAGNRDFLIAKYNSSGTLQWQRTLGGSGEEYGNAVAVTPSGDIYIAGTANTGGNATLIAKYNSSGTLQWQRRIADVFAQSICVDSSGNAIVGMIDYPKALIMKFNSGGSITWQRTLGPATGQETPNSMALDSTGAVYVAGITYTGSNTPNASLQKWDSGGTLQFQKFLTASGSDNYYAIAIDSLDNAYAVGDTDSAGGGGNDFFISKSNSSGTLQWQRTLGNSEFQQAKGVSIDSLDNLIVTGLSGVYSFNSSYLAAKLPSDGSLTGSYTLGLKTYTYAASTLTDSSSSLTGATSSFTTTTPSFTSSTSSLSTSSPSFSTELVSI